jgi:type II secretory pathway component PulM
MSDGVMRSPLAGLKPQDRRALLVGGVMLVLLVGYARVLKPGLASLAAERELVADQRALLVRERALVAVAPSLPARLKQVNQVLMAERPRLFAGDSVAASAELTAFASQVAQVAGVQLASIEARTPVTTRGVTRLTADVRGDGSWRQVLSFVRLLEVSGQLVEVSSVRLERGARGGPLGGDLVSFSATLTGYGRGAR